MVDLVKDVLFWGLSQCLFPLEIQQENHLELNRWLTTLPGVNLQQFESFLATFRRIWSRWFNVTFWSPSWRSRFQPFERSLNYPKKVRKACQDPDPIFATSFESYGYVFLRWFLLTKRDFSGVRFLQRFFTWWLSTNRLLWNSVDFFWGDATTMVLAYGFFSAFWSDTNDFRRWMAAWRALVWILSWGESRWNGSTKRDYLYNMYIYICSYIYIYIEIDIFFWKPLLSVILQETLSCLGTIMAFLRFGLFQILLTSDGSMGTVSRTASEFNVCQHNIYLARFHDSDFTFFFSG